MIFTLLVTIGLTGFCVALHDFVFNSMDGFLVRRKWHRKIKILVGLLIAFMTHVIEVGAFAVGYSFLSQFEECGRIEGDMSHALQDYFYYSITTYSTLGYGDLIPEGPLRIMAGVEALLGLVLVAWTASYFFAMINRQNSANINQMNGDSPKNN